MYIILVWHQENLSLLDPIDTRSYWPVHVTAKENSRPSHGAPSFFYRTADRRTLAVSISHQSFRHRPKWHEPVL